MVEFPSRRAARLLCAVVFACVGIPAQAQWNLYQGNTSLVLPYVNNIQLNYPVPACDYPRFSWCHDCELDIGESAQPAPDDDVAWRRIGGASQITTEARELDQIEAQCSRLGVAAS